jgi:hypothetical protein
MSVNLITVGSSVIGGAVGRAVGSQAVRCRRVLIKISDSARGHGRDVRPPMTRIGTTGSSRAALRLIDWAV